MNFWKRLFINIPDQVLSTMLMGVIILVTVRGITSVFQKPPSLVTIETVFGVGIVLGFLETIRQKAK